MDVVARSGDAVGGINWEAGEKWKETVSLGIVRCCGVPRYFCAVGVASEVVGEAWLYANMEKEKENTSPGYGIVSSLKLEI